MAALRRHVVESRGLLHGPGCYRTCPVLWTLLDTLVLIEDAPVLIKDTLVLIADVTWL